MVEILTRTFCNKGEFGRQREQSVFVMSNKLFTMDCKREEKLSCSLRPRISTASDVNR